MNPEIKISNEEFNKLIKPIIGLPICIKKVGFRRSLSIHLGEKKLETKIKSKDIFGGEWSIGTYYCPWRIVKESKIICGSQNAIDSIKELDAEVQKIELGSLTSIENYGSMDLRLHFNNSVSIDFLATTSDDSEHFHVFCPEKICLKFLAGIGWTKSRSDIPVDSF